jgi:iron complex transport system permease protein
MRLLFGPDNRVLLPAALFGGAAFLAAADCVARVVAYPVELPVGVITALTGAPFFLYLLVRK